MALVAQGSAASTIATRTDHVRRAARALGGSPWTVSEADLGAWVGGQDWARETRRGVYASVRGFYRWAQAVGEIDRSPAEGLPVVRPAAPAPRPVTEDALAEAIGHADPRARLILRLAAEAGLRRAEIAQVHRRDLGADLLGPTLEVHGKGGRDRSVPLSAGLAGQVRDACRTGHGWAFPGREGGHLSARWVGTIAARLLPEPWTLHTLRHRFATRAFGGSRDLLAVQHLLGHASPATTQRYVRPPAEAERAAASWAAA